jgi:Uncharacterized conserved protein
MTGNAPTPADAVRRRLAGDLVALRERTFRLLDHLDDDAVHRQFHRIMSPLVWDLGHVGNFEELWLLRELSGRPPHDPSLDHVYNPFENPRWVRGDLPLLDRRAASSYLAAVRGEVLDLLGHVELDPASPLLAEGYVFRMTVQHEAQHQETILQALDLRDDLAPYPPAARRLVPSPHPVDDTERVRVAGGAFLLGTDDRTAAYDNERPRHLVEVPTFLLDRFPVTNRRYAEFVTAGGYDRPELWSPAGWAWRRELDRPSPRGGCAIPTADGRSAASATFVPSTPGSPSSTSPSGRPRPSPVSWEADSPPRPNGRRPPPGAPRPAGPGPTRRGETPPTPAHANLDQRNWGPVPVGSYPLGASAYGVEQLLGDVYEWTSSPFAAYPGFRAFPYREYSEVFFDDPEFRVLRGASWATSRAVARTTFRNWDYRRRRQIMAGIRIAWDA